MESNKKTYGIVTQKNEKRSKLEPGTLLELISFQNNSSLYKVKVVDYLNADNMILQIEYKLQENCIKKIDTELWPYIIAIPDPYARLELAKNEEHCNEILSIKPNDLVTVKGSIFNHEKNFDCIVRYIDLVANMGPGYYFILEPLNLNNGDSPQRDDIQFFTNNIQFDKFQSNSMLTVSANAVTKVKNPKKNPFEIIGQTVQRAMDHTLKPNNKKITQSTNSKANQMKIDKSKNKIVYKEGNLENNSRSRDQTKSVKRHSPNDYEGSCDNLQNEETSEIYENYERRSERQHRNKNFSEAASYKPKKQLPITDVKPLNSMRLVDRDVVVIDEADIKESTKNESEVIVVEYTKQYELADFTGSDWPKSVGQAEFLNSDKSKNHSNSKQNDINKKDSLKKLKKCTDEINDNVNVTKAAVQSTLLKDDYLPPSQLPKSEFDLGTMVEVTTDGCKGLYGVVRFYGFLPDSKLVRVGVELDEVPSVKSLKLSNGLINGVQLFQCPINRGIFVLPSQCLIDQRFLDIDEPPSKSYTIVPDSKMFGQVECPIVPGILPSYKIYNLEHLDSMTGQFKGIQGHHNSCYLDATLFAMFTFTSVFDSLLYRREEPQDNSHYKEVQSVLRDEIVNPLRKNLFVRADRVMKLRQLLEKLSSVTGLTSEEKDPEEFLNSLLAQILRADPFLKLSSGQDAFFYQLFVEKDEKLNFPTVQQLFQQSFLTSDIKLREVPSCLIIQMPRFGKNYKMYPRILPTQLLDVTDIIEDSPRQCASCGTLAEYECRECFGSIADLDSTAFCKECLDKFHTKRPNHFPKEIIIPEEFKECKRNSSVPRVFMELFAVVCIETSHYVAFVKTGCGQDAPWCFFDSMADRRGEQNGYNVPEMVSVPKLPEWLSEETARDINNSTSNDKNLPEHAKRLLCDAYMCMYQSTDVMMYR